MAFYLVQLPAGSTLRHDGVDRMIVEADDAATAKSMADAYSDLDGAWSSATATDISTLSASDYAGWTLRVIVSDPAGLPGAAAIADISVTAGAADDLDAMGADAVTALNATASIANASYTTPTLTVAGAADSLGDHAVFATLTPPTSLKTPVTDLIGTITDEGAAGAALTMAFSIPTAIPFVTTALRST